MDSCGVSACISYVEWSRVQCLKVAFTASRVVSIDRTKERHLDSQNRMGNPVPVSGRFEKILNQVQEDSQELCPHFPNPALFILTSHCKRKLLELFLSAHRWQTVKEQCSLMVTAMPW